VVLVILWLLGLVTGYTMGNFIHILLVIAIIVVLVSVIGGGNHYEKEKYRYPPFSASYADCHLGSLYNDAHTGK
jgi:hypothetical protein